MAVRELVFDIFAIDRASKVFTRVGAESESMGSKLTKVTNQVGKATALAVLAVGVMSVKNALAMQESEAKIQGTAQITSTAAKSIGDAFLATSGKSTFSGRTMADAFGPVAGVIQSLSKHSLTAADSMKFMTAATTLAEATGQDLGATSDALAAVMQNYGLKVTDAADASNTLFNASRLTNIPLDTLTTTVDKLHGKLGIASPTLRDTSSLLVDLANHGISGSKGVLVVNSGLTTLLGGSKATSKELKTLGVNVFDAHGKFVGMKGVLEQLTPKLAHMTDKQRLAAESALFGAGAAKALDSTVRAGAAGLGVASKAVDKHNAAEDAATAKSSTLKGQMKTLGAYVSNLTTTFGEKLIPVITNVVGWLSKNTTAAAIIAGVIGGVLLAATIAWAVAMIAATWPILLIIAAVALLTAGIVMIATRTTWFQTIWQYMTSSLAAAWQWLWNSILAPIIRFVLNGFASITDGIANMLGILSNIPGFEWAKTAADKMHGAADKAHALAKEVHDIPKSVPVDVRFTSNWSVIGQQVASLINSKNKLAGMAAGKALGGVVSGVGIRDSEPTMLTPGEFVVDRRGSNLGAAQAHFGASQGGGSGPLLNIENYNEARQDPHKIAAEFAFALRTARTA